uniref:Uncharacterized protein n=1 Tax=Panagrolaimus superbus TaxID=310955 RepID=A0A914XRW2_9BILA
MFHNNRNNYDNVFDEDKSAESTLSSQKDNSLTMPSTSSDAITEEIQLLVNFIENAATSYSEGNLENALHYYEQAIMIDPGNNVLFANKSAILLKLGRIKEAIEEASHSIQLKPEWPKAHFRKAEALKEAKEFEKAIISYCQAIHANSESQRFLHSLILCAQKSIIGENFEAAYKQMKELGLEKSHFVTISVIGQQFLGVHDFQTAISILRIALNIDSPSLKLKESTLGALAKAYYEAKNFGKAIDYLELQLELVSQLKDIKTEIQVHENISEIAETQKDFQLALVHWDSQLRLCHQVHKKFKKN